jgi:5'-nucleotidase
LSFLKTAFLEVEVLILITNDDGINSDGIHILKEKLSDLARVVIIAPDQERSASGHSISLNRPLRVNKIGEDIFITDGTPSDCINLGASGFLPKKPDLVIAGINKSPNLGDDVTYSGTVAAAMEGTILGIPSFAISMAEDSNLDFTFAAKFARRVCVFLGERKLPHNTFLNINVPNLPEEEIRGVEITRLGRRVYRNKLVKRVDPRGRFYYWIGGEKPLGVEEEGTDFKTIAEHKVSITPLHLDMTNYLFAEELKRWIPNLSCHC